MTDKLEIHQSTLNTIFLCPASYALEKQWGRVPPSFFAIAGTGTHASIGNNMVEKAKSGDLLPLPVCQDIARDTVNSEAESADVLISEDEKTVGRDKLRGDAVDTAVVLSELHYKTWADRHNPAASKAEDGSIMLGRDGRPLIGVERRWRVDLEGEDYFLGGTMDLQQQDGRIIDFKTTQAAIKKKAAHNSDQLTMYALAAWVHGEPCPEQGLLYLQHQKTQVATQILWTTRQQADFHVLLTRVRAVVHAIKSGSFPPCPRDHWKCSPEYCFWNLTGKCPHVSGTIHSYSGGHGDDGVGERMVFDRVDAAIAQETGTYVGASKSKNSGGNEE